LPQANFQWVEFRYCERRRSEQKPVLKFIHKNFFLTLFTMEKRFILLIYRIEFNMKRGDESMNVLVINCGSSSLKYQVIHSDSEEVLAKGICERIGIDGRLVYQPKDGEKEVTEAAMPTHTEAVRMVLEALVNPRTGVLKSLDEINAVGHRLVHGGEKFAASTLLTEEVIQAVEECSDLAPLHNPANLIGVRACQEVLKDVPMVAVFDTAFHQTMPKEAYLYGIPYEYYEKYKVRKYGFHGTSHSYVSKRAAELLNKPYDDLKTIVCHLGNGASICAVKNGKSVDTSMGLTPLEGLVMGTRSGDIDPSAIEFLAKKENLDMAGIMNILNKESGVYGLSGISSDFRDLEAASNEGNERAAAAREVFCYRTAKYVGSYAAAMNGVDAICFTAGVGENDGKVREMICSYLGYLGIRLDSEANQKRGEEVMLSTPDSKVAVMLIPTNEELAICRETVAIVG
jgi:acetate kinase